MFELCLKWFEQQDFDEFEIKANNKYVKLRKNKYFRKLDLSTDLLLENISKLYNKETVLFVNAKKI